MFSFFKSKKSITESGLNFSKLKTDLHSHLIPGIDDGAQTLEDSITLIKKLIEVGYTKIITTPHIMADYYRNTPDTINRGLDIVREELVRQNISVEIDAAAEYYLDETFESKLAKSDVLTVGKEHLLFELSFVSYPPNLFDIIFKIKSRGLIPILAHPERYNYLGDSLETFQQIKDAGCYLQLNTISLTGYYGKQTQRTAEQLVDNMLIDFIASDMHHIKHAAALASSLNTPYVQRLLTDYQLQNELL